MGGRGSSGKSKGGGGGNSSNNILRSLSSGMTHKVAEELENMSIGTRIYDGSTTLTDRTGSWKKETTFYEKTSKYGWTRFGDTEAYDARTSTQVANTLEKGSKNPSFKLKIKKK